jgi:hypothetical protein
MNPITGVIFIRAKAGITIPAAPSTTKASLNPEVPKPGSMPRFCRFRLA